MVKSGKREEKRVATKSIPLAENSRGEPMQCGAEKLKTEKERITNNP